MIMPQSGSMDGGAHTYTELGGLNDLKQMADKDRGKALEGAARQFESLFLQQMLKAMRSANEAFKDKDSFLHSSEIQQYQEMFDKQLSLSLTRKDSIGIADALVRQLSDDKGSPTANSGGEPKVSIQDYVRSSVPTPSQQLPERVKEVKELMGESVSGGETPQTLPERFDSPQAFVSQLRPIAEKVSADSGVPSRVMLAQAALETGWGSQMIEGDRGEASHNLFGIKADQRWDGDSVRVDTTEYRDGVRLHERADFRAYSDYESSFRDYADFLKSSPRYEGVLEQADDPDAFAQALEDAGYATDPAYGRKIRGIMDGPVIRSFLEGATNGGDGS